MDHAMEHNTNGSGHEHREVDLKLIVSAGVALAVILFVVMGIIWGTFNLIKTDEYKHSDALSPLAPAVQVPPYPRVEEHPWEELRALRAHENEVLSGYAWQDQKSGIVRIPIDRAMDIVAQRGFPVQQPGAQTKPAGGKNAARK